MSAKERASLSGAKGDASAPFQRLLVGVDGSRASEHAGRWAAEIARLGRARATVLHVTAPTGILPPAGTDAATAPSLQRVLDAVIEELDAADAAAERLVTPGEPRAEVVRASHLARADLVCLGARGSAAARRVALGSVTEAVAARAAASVLVARGPPPAKRVLAASDGSPNGERALAVAKRLAEGWGVPLDVLVVVEGDLADARLPLASPEREPLLRAEVEVHSLLASGNAAEQIVAHAKSRGANLVVLGSRGASGEAKTAPGRVADRVLRGAAATVLMVKPHPADLKP